MPNKSERKKKAPAPGARVAPMERVLPMPKYDYQTPRTGSFVIRYEEQRQRQEKAGREKAPTLQNLKFVGA
jgi:hypothetical protein